MRTAIEALLIAVLLTAPVYAQVPDAKSAAGEGSALPAAHSSTAASGGSEMPPIGFVSTIAADELYDVLKGSPAFSSMDKEKPGNPIIVRVSHTYGHLSVASGIASAIFAGGTLGLLPAVSNRDLVVTYEILVNGSVLLRYSYAKNVTRVFNIHSTDKTHGLGDDGLAWVKGTAVQFAGDTARDAKYAALQAEYHYYYDSPAVTSAR
jgi:hypothetical protein